MAITKWTKRDFNATLNPIAELKTLFDTVERLEDEEWGENNVSMVFRVHGEGVPEDDHEIWTLYEDMENPITRGRLGYMIPNEKGIIDKFDSNNDPVVVWASPTMDELIKLHASDTPA